MTPEELGLVIAGSVAAVKFGEVALARIAGLIGFGKVQGREDAEREALAVRFGALDAKVNHYELRTSEAYDALRREMTANYASLQREMHAFQLKIAQDWASKDDLYRTRDEIIGHFDTVASSVRRRRRDDED